MPSDFSDTGAAAPRAPLRPAAPAQPVPAGLDAGSLPALREAMLRFALMQLRDAGAAEDLVQESIEAALRKASSFGGRSSLRTWVFAILRNRIVDHLRQSARTVTMSRLVDDGDDWQERVEALFDERGEWRPGARPRAWPDPEESMRTRQFWVVFETCLERLPPATARVFMMREFLGFEAGEICRLLGITTGNCHVILHRARMKLRGCLDSGWGRPEEGGC